MFLVNRGDHINSLYENMFGSTLDILRHHHPDHQDHYWLKMLLLNILSHMTENLGD
jgi:hypothetical protein